SVPEATTPNDTPAPPDGIAGKNYRRTFAKDSHDRQKGRHKVIIDWKCLSTKCTRDVVLRLLIESDYTAFPGGSSQTKRYRPPTSEWTREQLELDLGQGSRGGKVEISLDG